MSITKQHRKTMLQKIKFSYMMMELTGLMLKTTVDSLFYFFFIFKKRHRWFLKWGCSHLHPERRYSGLHIELCFLTLHEYLHLRLCWTLASVHDLNIWRNWNGKIQINDINVWQCKHGQHQGLVLTSTLTEMIFMAFTRHLWYAINSFKV